ncbi:MAG: hypothetical protein KGI71_05810 [Patescibacteria group bacterium]|nr:hypothetical protein [Patescibacteria group bacterium]
MFEIDRELLQGIRSESQCTTEQALADCLGHLARLESQRDWLLSGFAPILQWTRHKPVMSGIYLNCHDPDGDDWTVWRRSASGALAATADANGKKPGEFWCGPIEIGRAPKPRIENKQQSWWRFWK